MKNKRTHREFIDLWIGATMLLCVVTYHWSTTLGGGKTFLTSGDTLFTLSNGMFVWMMGMMWIAYSRWRNVSRKQAMLDDIIASTGLEVVLVVNDEGVITMCNDAITPVFGYQVDEVVGRDIELLYQPFPTEGEAGEPFRDAMSRIGFYRAETEGVSKHNQRMYLEVSTAVRKMGDGTVQMIQDITERKLAQERLQEAKEEAEQATLAKQEALVKLEASYARLRELEIHRDNLIHMVCHDMKAPLQVLILQLDILKEMVLEKLDNDELESVDTLLAYSRQLELMVHSMLDLSKLENGNLPMKITTGDLEESVREAITFVRAMAGECTVGYDDASSASRPIKYDQAVAQRVMVNLLYNAVKYSPGDGQVTVAIEDRADGLKVKITDNGPGIPEKYREAIFDKFGQIEEKEYQRSGSTGLGLTFCKLAVEAHGGTIGVDSVLGEGSTFWFVLPNEGANRQVKSNELMDLPEEIAMAIEKA